MAGPDDCPVGVKVGSNNGSENIHADLEEQ